MWVESVSVQEAMCRLGGSLGAGAEEGTRDFGCSVVCAACSDLSPTHGTVLSTLTASDCVKSDPVPVHSQTPRLNRTRGLSFHQGPAAPTLVVQPMPSQP